MNTHWPPDQISQQGPHRAQTWERQALDPFVRDWIEESWAELAPDRRRFESHLENARGAIAGVAPAPMGASEMAGDTGTGATLARIAVHGPSAGYVTIIGSAGFLLGMAGSALGLGLFATVIPLAVLGPVLGLAVMPIRLKLQDAGSRKLEELAANFTERLADAVSTEMRAVAPGQARAVGAAVAMAFEQLTDQFDAELAAEIADVEAEVRKVAALRDAGQARVDAALRDVEESERRLKVLAEEIAELGVLDQPRL